MKYTSPLGFALALCLGESAFAQIVHQPFQPPMTAEKIRIAIDDAVFNMRSRQAADGSIDGPNGTPLAALAMLAAGVDPAADKQLQQALEYLAQQETNNTYVRGLTANVWEYALRRVPYEKSYRLQLKKDFDWLMQAIGDREGWRYTMQSRDWDNSCTQYGVLGVWAATRAGFDPGEKFWQTMSKHFRGCQNGDGGWGYTTGGSSPNMATAGLASMFLVFDTHFGKSFYSRENPRTFEDGEAAEVLKSIERGMTWLGGAKGQNVGGYYYYGIERTGVASGRKYIGGRDWFAEGALAILQAQQTNGSIPMCRYGAQYGTPLCTLFLVYGGAPIAFNKLQYGDGHDWNLNPRDLANLTKDLWSAYERPLNWQTVSIDAPDAEFEAPVLFISGSKAAEFSEEEMLKLREYVLRGGTVLAESSDHSEEFSKSMEQLLAGMFDPREYPSYKLQPLAEDHALYTVIKQEWKQRPKLRGAGDGSRLIFVLSDEYLSADWQMNRTDSDAFKLATNLLFYVTDLGSLPGKFTSILPETPAAEPRELAIEVARVQFESAADDPRDWDAAAMTWTAFAPYVKHVTGSELKERNPVRLERDSLEGVQVLHLSGRKTLKLSDAERQALKQFAEQGGTVLVDAYAGSKEFADSARAELEKTFGQLKPLPADHVLSEGRFTAGADLARGVRFKLPARLLLRQRGQDTSGQKLLVAEVNGLPAVLFSEFDLSAALAGANPYRALGYKADSARKIVANVLAYVTAD